jgi:ribosome-binding protein aMBF1 (putative translation factor)
MRSLPLSMAAIWKIMLTIDYENGKAVPNQQILAKMERVLGVKLRGKEIGAKLEDKHAAKK